QTAFQPNRRQKRSRCAGPLQSEVYDREKTCYEQKFEQARSVNSQVNQVPLTAMTLTGGLWFGARRPRRTRFCSNEGGRGGLLREVGFDFGGEVEQQAQERPQPGEREADVVAGADEDGVDGVAAGAGEAVAFEQAVGFRVADDRLDRGPSAQLAF